MNWRQILFSFEGRVGRRVWWLATLAVVAAVLALTLAPFLIQSESVAVFVLALGSQLIWLASLWPMLAVAAKRLHDRNKSGWWLLVFWLLPFVLFWAGLSITLFNDPRTGRSGDFLTGAILMSASLPFALWGVVELGVLKGTRGPNGFGVEPEPGQGG